MVMSEAINYKIFFDQVNKHLLKIVCTIQQPDSAGQEVALPAWVPGSYVIRNFAKHIVSIEAEAAGQPVAMQKIDKQTWQCAPCTDPLQITYHVYCFDSAPRGAYADNERVFFDGCRLFLVVAGEEEQTRSVEIVKPDFADNKAWKCATSMKSVKVDKHGFGTYSAENHLELIDHPFIISNFQQVQFKCAGVEHQFVLQGACNVDLERLKADVTKICNGHIDYFGELPPMDKYVFICHASPNGYGGIEHRSSCALACAFAHLPILGAEQDHDKYPEFLGLVSHEYLHLWNVKRIKPEVFVNPDLYTEVYTRQLWIFEGITSYLDNLNLVRTGLISIDTYLEVLAKDITRLQKNPGAFVQNLEDASFDSWIKFYLPDENSVNSAVSYYLKGSLVALALDLQIINSSDCKQSLADVMQVLWQQHGKTGLGLPEDYFARIVFEVTGDDYSEFFAKFLQDTVPLPLPELLLQVGVVFKNAIAPLADKLGWNVTADKDRLLVRNVLSNSAAERAGIAPFDQIVAINRHDVNMNNVAEVLQFYVAEETLAVHYFRDGRLFETTVDNCDIVENICNLELVADTNSQQELQRTKWLGNIF